MSQRTHPWYCWRQSCLWGIRGCRAEGSIDWTSIGFYLTSPSLVKERGQAKPKFTPPSCIHIGTMSNNIITPIRLDIHLSTQGKYAGARVVIDSTCEGILANESWIKKHDFPTYTLSHPICIRNTDDTINKADLIWTSLDVNLMVYDQWGRTHTECVQMFITNLEKDDILLGTDWLKYHNPSIGWRHHKVHFDWCP